MEGGSQAPALLLLKPITSFPSQQRSQWAGPPHHILTCCWPLPPWGLLPKYPLIPFLLLLNSLSFKKTKALFFSGTSLVQVYCLKVVSGLRPSVCQLMPQGHPLGLAPRSLWSSHMCGPATCMVQLVVQARPASHLHVLIFRESRVCWDVFNSTMSFVL